MESEGLWLVGVGALLLALVGLTGVRVRVALTFGGDGDRRVDRVKFAVTGAGMVFTALGSALIAISSVPSVEFVVITIVTLLLIIYVLLAWRVHTLWREHLTAAAERLHFNQDSRREMWDLDAARWCARWQWALRHPLSDAHATSWPMGHLEREHGPRPPGPPESPEAPLTAMKLRQNRPNVARADIGHLPSWTQDVALIARDCDWTVLRSDHTLALYTPDGSSVVTANVDGARAVVQLLRRHELLARLSKHGFPTHHAAWGQLAPGRRQEHLLRILAQTADDDRQDLEPG